MAAQRSKASLPLLIISCLVALASVNTQRAVAGQTPADIYNSTGRSQTTLRGGVQQNVQAPDPMHCFWDAYSAVQNAVQAYQLALNGALNQSFACHGQAYSAELEACWAPLNLAKAKIETAAPIYERARSAGPLSIVLTGQANRLNTQARTSLDQAYKCFQPIYDRWFADYYSVNGPGRNSTLPPNAQLPPIAPPPRGNLPGPIGYPPANVGQRPGTRPCTEDSAVGAVQGTLTVDPTNDAYHDPTLTAPQTMVLLLNQNNKPGRMGQTWQFQITSATKVNWPHPGPPSKMANVHFPCESRDLTDIYFLPATSMVPALQVRQTSQSPIPDSQSGPDVLSQCVNAVANAFCPPASAEPLPGDVQQTDINTGSRSDSYYPPAQMVADPNTKLKGKRQVNQPAGSSSTPKVLVNLKRQIFSGVAQFRKRTVCMDVLGTNLTGAFQDVAILRQTGNVSQVGGHLDAATGKFIVTWVVYTAPGFPPKSAPVPRAGIALSPVSAPQCR